MRAHGLLTFGYARLIVRWAWLKLRWRGRLQTDGLCFIGPGVTFEIGKGARVKLGRWCWIGHGSKIRAHEGEVEIGAKTVMGQECTISAFQHVSVGRECIVADRVMLIDFDHGVVEVERPIRLQGIYKRDVRVGHNCWIGYGACILRGATVGDNSVVGTSAVVTKDLPANSVSAGQPARILRMRDEPETLRWRLASLAPADRPGRRAALGVQLGRHRVLDGLGRRRRIAAAAELAPGGAGELVLAAVLTAGRDRGRVAAGLALGDPGERARAGRAGRRVACVCVLAGAEDAEMPRLPSVAGPAMPSTARPWLRW